MYMRLKSTKILVISFIFNCLMVSETLARPDACQMQIDINNEIIALEFSSNQCQQVINTVNSLCIDTPTSVFCNTVRAFLLARCNLIYNIQETLNYLEPVAEQACDDFINNCRRPQGFPSACMLTSPIYDSYIGLFADAHNCQYVEPIVISGTLIIDPHPNSTEIIEEFNSMCPIVIALRNDFYLNEDGLLPQAQQTCSEYIYNCGPYRTEDLPYITEDSSWLIYKSIYL